MDLRKLKDQAAKANEKRQFAKAAELYLQIASFESQDPDWRQRAGEALRKEGQNPDAAEQFKLAAEGYARAGFLLKAIAACKVVLQVDPGHTATQEMLSRLYAQRDSRPKPSATELIRTQSGNFSLIPVEMAIPPAVTTPPPPSLDTPGLAPLGLELAALDEIGLDKRTIPVGAPMEVVPLAIVLNGTKSGQFHLDEILQEAREPSGYEITLDDIIEEVEPPPIPHVPLVRLDSELSVTGLAEELMAPPAPLPELPRIPLLSSLGPQRMRRLIERVEVRELSPGEVVVREGERGGSLFLIVSGHVQVQVGDRQVAQLGDGDFFGEQAILTDQPRTATVTATAPTQLLELSRALVSELVADSPDVLRTLLSFFRDRLLNRLIGTSALFNSLSPEDARALSERFLFLELEPKLRVIREGERAPGLFLLLAGEAQVLMGQLPIAKLGPGDVFGEMSLLAGTPAMASITTLTKCWALELPAKQFQEIMVSYPQVLAYVSELAERRSASNDRIELL